MKHQIAALVFVVVVSGCASLAPHTQWQDYRTTDNQAAGSGTVRTILGMEYWTDGMPDKPNRVIGIIEQSYEDSAHFQRSDRDEEDMVKLARQHGADALVVIDSQLEQTGFATRSQQYNYSYMGPTTTGRIVPVYQRRIKVAAVKYMP